MADADNPEQEYKQQQDEQKQDEQKQDEQKQDEQKQDEQKQDEQKQDDDQRHDESGQHDHSQEPRTGGRRKRSVLRSGWNWVWPVALGVLAAKALSTWVFGFAYVPSASMFPAIENPGHILLDHLAVETMPIYEGEVVVFHWPDDPSQIFVKRVIGLPGDTILIQGGYVYRNGVKLHEPYLEGLVTEGNYGLYQVPAGHYFMLGDNRNVSDDSRKWVHKYVPRSYIIARADFQVSPLKEFHHIPQ